MEERQTLVLVPGIGLHLHDLGVSLGLLVDGKGLGVSLGLRA
jgi:hypothetical protein